MKANTQQLQDFSTQVRRDILRMVHAVNSGHPGGSLGCTDVVTALYFQQLKINNRKGKGGFISFKMDGIGEDLFLAAPFRPARSTRAPADAGIPGGTSRASGF